MATVAEPSAVGPSDSCWTAERKELRAWLGRLAPQLADLYAGAVAIATNDTFPGRVIFVWHAIREIRNRLPDVLAGEVASSNVQYSDLTKQICRCWVTDGWPEDGSLPLDIVSEPSVSGPERYEISRKMLAAISDLVSQYVAIERRNEEKAERLFETVAGAAVPTYVVKTWLRGGRKAHKLAHLSNKLANSNDEGSLASDFAAFEGVLMTISKRAYENMDDLDEILDSANR
jgi:hypothetical protein